MAELDCDGKSTREINAAIRRLVEAGEVEFRVRNPAGRHNLAVALLKPVRLTFDGSVGYYCGGMGDGPGITIHGTAGWGLAECLMSGTIVVHGNAGNGAGASLLGGEVVVRGDAAARAGIAMKGGLLLIEGSCGYMTGFMMQRGTIIVCGDAGEGLADSMYEGTVYVGGGIAELGNDAVVHEPTAEERAFVAAACARHGIAPPSRLQKVVAGRRLWTFDKKEFELWKAAL